VFGQLWFGSQVDPSLVRASIPAPFITRLRTRMLVDHLDEDLELGPDGDSGRVDRILTAGDEIARPFDDAPPPEDDGCNVQQRASAHVLTIAFIADVVRNAALTTGTKALVIVALVFLPVVAWLAYGTWRLRQSRGL